MPCWAPITSGPTPYLSAPMWATLAMWLLGFRAMKFNLVVSTNTERTLPGAFRHRQLGYVDALVMFQGLAEGPTS